MSPREDPIGEGEGVRLPHLGHHRPFQLGVQVHDVRDLTRRDVSGSTQ